MPTYARSSMHPAPGCPGIDRRLPKLVNSHGDGLRTRLRRRKGEFPESPAANVPDPRESPACPASRRKQGYRRQACRCSLSRQPGPASGSALCVASMWPLDVRTWESHSNARPFRPSGLSSLVCKRSRQASQPPPGRTARRGDVATAPRPPCSCLVGLISGPLPEGRAAGGP
jgi:hypothetical protein